MILDRIGLISALERGGVPNAWEPFRTRLDGVTFSTVSADWVRDVWREGVAALAANAPVLVENGLPRYVINGFNCRGHTHFIYAHGLLGFAIQGATATPPLTFDALAFGWLSYEASPHAVNRHRSGPHRILWHVDHAGIFQTFEGGDGRENELTPGELASINLVAQ
jgi:hypothetical protein